MEVEKRLYAGYQSELPAWFAKTLKGDKRVAYEDIARLWAFGYKIQDFQIAQLNGPSLVMHSSQNEIIGESRDMQTHMEKKNNAQIIYVLLVLKVYARLSCITLAI